MLMIKWARFYNKKKNNRDQSDNSSLNPADESKVALHIFIFKGEEITS